MRHLLVHLIGFLIKLRSTMSVRKCSQKQLSNLIPKKQESNADYYCGLDVVGAPHIQSFDPYTYPYHPGMSSKSKHISIVAEYSRPCFSYWKISCIAWVVWVARQVPFGCIGLHSIAFGCVQLHWFEWICVSCFYWRIVAYRKTFEDRKNNE